MNLKPFNNYDSNSNRSPQRRNPFCYRNSRRSATGGEVYMIKYENNSIKIKILCIWCVPTERYFKRHAYILMSVSRVFQQG